MVRGGTVLLVLVILHAVTAHPGTAAPETPPKAGQIPRVAYLGPGPLRCESPGDTWFAIKAAFLDGLKQASFAPMLPPELQWMAPHFAKHLGAPLWEPPRATSSARPVLWQPQCFQDDTMVIPLVADLLRREPAVIVVNGTPAALAAQRATRTVPIVFAGVGDPVGSALVASLARPGANVTGVANLQRELVHKRVELLTELLPGIRHVAALVDPVLARSIPYLWAGTEEAARVKAIDLKRFDAASGAEIDTVFPLIAASRAQALLVLPSQVHWVERSRISRLALQYRLPLVGPSGAEDGALLSYDTHYPEMYRHAGAYVARILSGEKPADLPVAQPTLFTLEVNLKTARALGVVVPPSLRLRATRIIHD